MEIHPPPPPRGTARSLHYVADIYSDGPRMWRWRASVFDGNETRHALVESNGGEQDEELARQAAREWLTDQSRLIHGADY